MIFSNKRAMPEARRMYHIKACQEAVRMLVEHDGDNAHYWRIISDVVNMCDTFVKHKGGQWKGAGMHGRTITLGDDDGLVSESMQVMALAGVRHVDYGEKINLTPAQGAIILDLIDVYDEILEVLVESEVEKCRNIVRQHVRTSVRRLQKQREAKVVAV